MAAYKVVRFVLAGLTVLAMSPVATVLAGSTTSDKGYTVDPCYKQCHPLQSSVHPASEAKRVFHNCMALCQGHGIIICPNGVTATVGKSTCH
jgi:hypothetical protein